MATFVYNVRDRSGKIFSGSMEGDNREVVVARLREMNYFITSVNEKRKPIIINQHHFFKYNKT